jgi:hypothetical protein
MPNQMSRLAPLKPCSATVGTSGKNGERFSLTTANQFDLSSADMREGNAGVANHVGLPCQYILQCWCSTFVGHVQDVGAVACLNSSQAKWGGVPAPAEA